MKWYWLCLLLFIALAVGAGFILKLLALPGAGPGGDGGEVRQEVRDGWAITKKLLDHYGPEGLEQFSDRHPGEFEPLVKAGVLSEEDGRVIDRSGFQSFSFRRSVEFSRRYEFTLYYVPGRYAADALALELNHRGEPVRSDTLEEDVSSDLAADVGTMWAVDRKGCSPPEAIPVASRVFNSVELVGRTREEVIALLGDPQTRRPGGRYNFPFHPAGGGDLVYRFDTGNYGWQFNVQFGWNGRCSGVEREWIH